MGNVQPGAVICNGNDGNWIRTSALSPLPMYAVRAGYDKGGCPIYVGRAFYNGDQLPANIVPDKGVAFVSYRGTTVATINYDVLVGQHYSWMPCSGGAVPPNAIRCGVSAHNIYEPVYIGRAYYEHTLTIGKVSPTSRCLFIPFNGIELSITNYEVLVSRLN